MRISDWSSDVCSSDLRLDLFDDRVLAALHQILGLVPIAARLRGLEVPRLESVEIGEDAILVGEAHWPPPKFVIASAAKQSPARSSNAAPATRAGERRVATLRAMTVNGDILPTLSDSRGSKTPSRPASSGRLRARPDRQSVWE